MLREFPAAQPGQQTQRNLVSKKNFFFPQEATWTSLLCLFLLRLFSFNSLGLQEPECTVLQSGFAIIATMADRQPSGPWGFCSTIWSAEIFPLSMTKRSSRVKCSSGKGSLQVTSTKPFGGRDTHWGLLYLEGWF